MRVHLDGRAHRAAGYVGSRPTFGEGEPMLEAYLLDFTGNAYGKEVEAEFVAFIRPDQAFATPEALAAQMGEDCDQARTILARIEADDPIRRFPLARALAKEAPAT
jgi:riboflavin kinase / FMN adenylyltransferase